MAPPKRLPTNQEIEGHPYLRYIPVLWNQNNPSKVISGEPGWDHHETWLDRPDRLANMNDYRQGTAVVDNGRIGRINPSLPGADPEGAPSALDESLVAQLLRGLNQHFGVRGSRGLGQMERPTSTGAGWLGSPLPRGGGSTQHPRSWLEDLLMQHQTKINTPLTHLAQNMKINNPGHSIQVNPSGYTPNIPWSGLIR